MSKELVIGSNRHETKVAILEDDQLVEVYFQRENEYSLAGSIHKGRVTRVLPGMQSAFVDLGLERDTFLYVSDFFEENDDIDTVVDEKQQSRGDRRERGDRSPRPIEFRAVPAPEGVEAADGPLPLLEPEDEEDPEEIVLVPEPFPALKTEPVQAAGRIPDEARGSEQQRPESRSEGDRGLRTDPRAEPKGGDPRGDRRGRRSRRRRSRSNGFPDNKYAQPGVESEAPEESPEHHEAPAVRAVAPENAPDVIILPGESLAKYRHLTSSSSAERVEADHVERAEREDAIAAAVPGEADLDAEAEEIALADRVLSHRGSSTIEEEDALAEVEQDQRTSPFIVSDIEAEEEAEEPVHATNIVVSLPTPVEVVEPGTLESSDPVPEPEPPEESGLWASEIAGGAMVAALEEVEEVDVVEFDTTDDRSREAESLVSELVLREEVAGDEEPAPAESASVREQSDRYPHRVGGRRMRRRRGGNRAGQPGAGQPNPAPGREDLPGPRVVEGRGSGATVGVAAAAEGRPELRPELQRQESRREAVEERSVERGERVMPSITELLKPGQEIIVQIAKEPLGQKGARITSHIALPGRFVVFMPSVTHLGVSRKIASDEERQRLKRILQAHREGTTGGFIVRTAGEGVPEEEIAADMDFLYKLWLDIRQKAEKKPAPMLLHYDLDVVQRILRDQVTEEFKAIWVDNEDMYENVLSFMQRFQPALVNRVKMYTRAAPIYDAFGITQELEKALRPKVWLKSGGYIVINQTEALVAIDINTGKYVGKSNRLEDTIVKTNIEAVKEIVRQIRLRDLGGIIVVDFIDMDERKNRQKVMQALEEAMRVDKAPYKILQFNDFGLVAITRKRVKQSLERTLCSPCPYCEGAGYVKSVQTVIGEILVEAQKLAKAIEGKDALLRVHLDVAKVLKGNDNRFLEEIEEILKRPVLVKGDSTLHIEKFDLG
jgi:Rne/Rng family ribonuclease